MRRFTKRSNLFHTRQIRVLFIVPYPEDCAPSQRLKFEQHLAYLRQQGVQYDYAPFMSKTLWCVVYKPGHYGTKILHTLFGYLRRIRDVLRCRRYDLVYLHLEAAPFGPPIFERLIRWMGVPILYDLDDLIYLPHESPANPLVKFLRSYHKIPKIIGMSDQVIVVTQHLVAYAKKYNTNVIFIPPTIDTVTYLPKRNYQKKQVCIGWTGSYSTSKYLRLLEPVLREICKHHDVKILVIGDEEFSIPGLPIEAKPWNHAAEVEDIGKIDIGLYPLPKTEWVLGKGGLKALQYMGMGIPTVCTRYGAATEIIRDGENGFLADSHREWVEKLSLLITNAEFRKRMGQRARRTVEERYAVRMHAPTYHGAIQHLTRPRILHLISDLDIGGTEKMLSAVVQHLQGQYEFHICSIALPGAVADEIHRTSDAKLYTLDVHTKLNLMLFPKFAFLIWRIRPTILQTYLFHDNFIGRVVGRMMRVPVRIAGQRAINTEEPLFRRLLECVFWRWSDLIVANSRAGKRILVERERIPASHISVIPNGKDVPTLRGNSALIRRRLGISRTAPIVTVVAKLRHQKGHTYLLDAVPHILARFPDTLFLFVGDGPIRDALEMRARALRLSAVRFLGDRGDVQDLLSVTDVFVMPSLWEGMSGAIIEAMAMALPVVATAVSGTPELVVDGKTGYLVPPCDADALAVRILALLERPALRRRFGAAGRQCAAKRFSVPPMIEAYRNLYDRLLAKEVS